VIPSALSGEVDIGSPSGNGPKQEHSRMAVMNWLNKPFFRHHFTFDAACHRVSSPPDELLDLRMTLTENRPLRFGVMR
jgi:hypothetical protein